MAEIGGSCTARVVTVCEGSVQCAWPQLSGLELVKVLTMCCGL